MGKIYNQDTSQFDRNQWVDFLKEGAYRGAKINKMARKNNSSSKLIKDQNQIELTYGTKKITIKLAKLLKKHDDWTFSRLIHNVKMWFPNTQYAIDFKARMEALADAIVTNRPAPVQNPPTQKNQDFSTTLNDFVAQSNGLDDIKTFFDTHSKAIDAETGNQEVQDNLFKLSTRAREQFNDPNLAHLIASKATGVMPPDFDVMKVIPQELQERILADYIFQSAGMNPFTFAELETHIPQSRLIIDQWAQKDRISLKNLGCKDVKDAVQYIFDHKYKCANLMEFYVTPKVLEFLHQKCPDLESLSLKGPGLSFDQFQCRAEIEKFITLKKLVLEDYSLPDVKELANLEELSLLYTHGNLPNIDYEAIGSLTKLQKFSFKPAPGTAYGLTDEMADALGRLVNLRSLDISGYSAFWISQEKLIATIENLPLLQTLTLTLRTKLEGREYILDFLKNRFHLAFS